MTLNLSGAQVEQEQMKLLAGCVVAAGLALVGWPANAQTPAANGAGRSLYRTVSDFDGPYGGMPPAPPPYGAPVPYDAAPAYDAPVPYEDGPELMPPREVYAVLRENGFQPLGVPRRQGYLYAVSAIDPDGTDGRVLVDGRDGRILRFMPAGWISRPYEERGGPYGAQAALPQPTAIRSGPPRPPAPIPHVASRPVPMPAPKPAETAAAPPQPRVSAPAASPATTGTVGEAKPPQPAIQPTQDMPPVQGLD